MMFFFHGLPDKDEFTATDESECLEMPISLASILVNYR